MKLPRDISGEELAKALGRLGYKITRQTGSHMRLSHHGKEGTHHLTIPAHKELKVGTLSRIIKDVAHHLSVTTEELLQRLWGDGD